MTPDEYVQLVKEVKHRVKQIDKYKDELPMGYQAQVDMGQIWFSNAESSRTRVYCFAMGLSHSRYKYILWSARPFTTATFMEPHNKAFDPESKEKIGADAA